MGSVEGPPSGPTATREDAIVSAKASTRVQYGKYTQVRIPGYQEGYPDFRVVSVHHHPTCVPIGGRISWQWLPWACPPVFLLCPSRRSDLWCNWGNKSAQLGLSWINQGMKPPVDSYGFFFSALLQQHRQEFGIAALQELSIFQIVKMYGHGGRLDDEGG